MLPDPGQIEKRLNALLSKRCYGSLFYHRNEFRNPKKEKDPCTPVRLAKDTAEIIFKNKLLVDPVDVVELRGYTELYRVHDGKKTLFAEANVGNKVFPLPGSAGTLGMSWFEREVGETIWKAMGKYPKEEQERQYLEFLRTANFVRPEWNAMLYIVCMTVPVGAQVVVVRGRGNWKAMQTSPKKLAELAKPGPPGSPPPSPPIRTPKDVEDHLGMMALPGTVQCVVPLYNDLWVRQVVRGTPKGPFVS